MHTSDRKLIYLLWTVIAVLVVGFVAGGIVAVKHFHDVDQKNVSVNGDNQSLKRQVQQLRAAMAATPTPTDTPLATPEPTLAPTPTPKK